MQELLDKLASAGWIAGSLTIDRENKNYIHTIQWTDEGKKQLEKLFFLIGQIESNCDSLLTAEELAQLRSLAIAEQLKEKYKG